ncbi:hypothetical protein ACJMK2_029068 [Sinanodonta woodiana]|uniref:RING-type domain-containing protein n=1 Tax=Sinanodonta woodiana TaxID=1069815 RepID=A0ABD3XCM6_SINWO
MEKTRHPQLSQYSTRLASFVHSQFVTDHEALAHLGFFYQGQGDRVCCYECGVTLSRWRQNDAPLLEHLSSSPECRHLATIIDPTTLQDYKIQVQKLKAVELGIENRGVERAANTFQDKRKKIKCPEYSSYSVRLSTFARFPVIHGLDVHGVAAAGFYYTGCQDIVRCYACNGCLKSMELGEDPWMEHYTCFPDCPHLEQLTSKLPGRETVAGASNAQSGEKSPQEVVAGVISELSTEDQKSQKQDIEPDLNTPGALAVLDFGYSRQAIKMAIEELRKKGQTTLTANGILQVLISFEDKGLKLPLDFNAHGEMNDLFSERKHVSSKKLSSEENLACMKSNGSPTSETKDISNLLKENENLTKMMTCKRCRKRQRNVLVLPCTHFCLCEQCSKEVSLCPECWKPITERVKTYLS